MKTSKIIMGALVGLMATTVSVKALSVKEACEQDPELYWLENTGECLPVHPCQDDELKNDEKYCNKVFANVQTNSPELAKKFVEYYLHVRGVYTVNVHYDIVNVFGQDYVSAGLEDGRRIEFEFDDIKERGRIAPMSLAKTICNLIFNKTFDKVDEEGYSACGVCRDMDPDHEGLFMDFGNAINVDIFDSRYTHEYSYDAEEWSRARGKGDMTICARP